MTVAGQQHEPTGIAVVGSANADLVIKVARRPGAGETLMGGDLTTVAGGKGANQAAAAALAGAPVRFVGCVGGDGNGEMLRESLRSAGVDTSPLLTSDRPTGTAVIFLTADGENSIVVSPGANQELTIERAMAQSASWRTAATVVLSLEVPHDTVAHVANDAAAHGVRVIVNAAPAAQLSDATLAHCNPLIVNEHEALEVLGAEATDPERDDFEALARRLLAAGAQSAIITLGSAGAVIATSENTTHLPAFTVEAVDTTGAGDAFVGAVAAELDRGAPLTDAVTFAQAMSALSVQRFGAQTSYVTEAEVRAFLAERTA